MLNEKPLERMRRKILVENLWFFILRLLKKKPRYGFEIRALLEKDFGFWVGNVTAYKVLYDLEEGKYVVAEEQFYKKKYNITKKGLLELNKTDKFLKSLLKNNKLR